jgi:hypothetical protein
MPNGRRGDNPISDILIWNEQVYGPEIDALVRELWELLPPTTTEAGEYVESPFDQPPLVSLIFVTERDPAARPELREELLALRDRLRARPAE